MNGPKLPSGIVAQAVYTWSPTLVNGSKGMGFSAISPSLVESIDWLSRLNLPEFNLFQGDVTGASSYMVEAKKGFSEVGRMLADGIAIAYRKTADGEVSEPARPHPVVHAIMAEPSVLGLSSLTRMRDDLWIRKVEGPGGGGRLNLADFAPADIFEIQGASTGHSCPGDHQHAENFLRMLATYQFESEGTIPLPNMDVIAAVCLAFPENVANGFSLTPYVEVDDVRRELVLRVAAVPVANELAAANPSQCPFERAVEQAARRFLYCTSPSLIRYAEEVLTLSKGMADATATHPVQRPAVATVTETEINPVYGLIDQVRDGTGPLSDDASKVLIGRLASAGIGPAHVLDLPPEVLTEMFEMVGDREVIWQWSRKIFADTGAETFVDLWNRTRVGAFLGFVLLKNLNTAENEAFKVVADEGVTPGATAAILRSMKSYPNGGRSIGRIILRGLGDTEAMRQFIAETFSGEPKFLFDAVLADLDIPPGHMRDYIRSCYEPWTAYRRIPPREAMAIYQALRLTWVQRLKKRVVRQREAGPGTSE